MYRKSIELSIQTLKSSLLNIKAARDKTDFYQNMSLIKFYQGELDKLRADIAALNTFAKTIENQ